MTEAPRPRAARRGPIVFMAIWLTLWSAAILVVLWMLGGAALSGDLGAAPFLLLWLGFAGLGLYAGLRRMRALLGLAGPPAPPPPVPSRRGRWDDGLAPREARAPASPASPTPAPAMPAPASSAPTSSGAISSEAISSGAVSSGAVSPSPASLVLPSSAPSLMPPSPVPSQRGRWDDGVAPRTEDAPAPASLPPTAPASPPPLPPEARDG